MGSAFLYFTRKENLKSGCKRSVPFHIGPASKVEEDPVTKHPFYFFTVIRRRRQGSLHEDTHNGLLAAIVPVYVKRNLLQQYSHHFLAWRLETD